MVAAGIFLGMKVVENHSHSCNANSWNQGSSSMQRQQSTICTRLQENCLAIVFVRAWTHMCLIRKLILKLSVRLRTRFVRLTSKLLVSWSTSLLAACIVDESSAWVASHSLMPWALAVAVAISKGSWSCCTYMKEEEKKQKTKK